MKTKKTTISMIVISALMLIVVVSLSVAFAKKQALLDFEQEGNELIYLTTIMHNDGDPGTEIFTWDLQNALGYEKEK